MKSKLGLPDASSITTTAATKIIPPSSASNPSSELPWQVLGGTLGFSNHDQELWWRTAAPKLNSFLRQCEYDIHRQYQYLSFFHRHVLPVLGPFFTPGSTPNYISRLSKHGHPLDISVNFQKSGAMVRMTFGVVGSFACLQRDPFNQLTAKEVLNGLVQVDPSIDLQVFNHFESELYIAPGDVERTASSLPKTDWATKMLSVDMRKDGKMAIKVYCMFSAKAVAAGRPAHALIFDAIQRLGPAFDTGLSMVQDFISPLCDSKQAYLGLLAFDCAPVESSRIKLYVHFDGTWDAVCKFWTLGGAVHEENTTKGLRILERVCEILEIRWADASAQALPILVNYDIAGNSLPKPQLYLFLVDRRDQFDAERLREVFDYLQWTGVPLYQDKETDISSLL